MNIVTIILGLFSLLGTFGTFYYGRKASHLAKEQNRLAKKQNRFSWGDIQLACRQLARQIKRSVKPDAIVHFSGPSGIIANLVVQSADYFVPLYTIILQKPNGPHLPVNSAGWRTLITSRWTLHIPESLLHAKPKKICLIDDVVISGDSLQGVSELLVNAGFDSESIWSCSVVCSAVAKKANKAPDRNIYIVEDDLFYMPWGKGY